MKNLMAKKVLLIAALVPCAALLRCANPNSGGTETGDARVTSMLYNPGGSPAVGVTVYIRPDSVLADTSLGLPATAGTDSTVTDNNGNYSFDTSLDAGTYVIEAANGNNAVLIDSVVVSAGPAPDTLPPDTLRPAGAIKGIVYLSEGGDPRKVFVLAFGIDRFTSVNADGSFKFSALARGSYNLRLISSLDDYDVLDTVGVPVLTADTTDLGTIELPYTGIPVPRGLQIQYDTMKQIVTLIWNRPVSGRPLMGYNIYRKHQDSSRVLLKSDWTDTVYHDSTGIQDITYEYRVAAVDTFTIEGTKSAGDSVTVTSAYILALTMGNGIGQGAGMFTSLSDIVVSERGRIYAGDASSVNKIWVFDTLGGLIDSIGEVGTDTGQVDRVTSLGLWGDSLLVTDQGNKAQVFNENGNYVLRLGVIGSGDSLLSSNYILGISYFPDRYYVMDYSEIKIFDHNGTFLNKFAGRGTGPGQILTSEYIHDIAIDSIGNVLLRATDWVESRIIKYNSVGTYLNEFTVPYHVDDYSYNNGLIYTVDTDPNNGEYPTIVRIYYSIGTLIGKFRVLGYFDFITVAKNGKIFLGSSDEGHIGIYSHK
jgi:hypothetical protein